MPKASKPPEIQSTSTAGSVNTLPDREVESDTVKTDREDTHYVVQVGDSLHRLAERMESSPTAIREANDLSSDMILVGQELIIPHISPHQKTVRKPAATYDELERERLRTMTMRDFESISEPPAARRVIESSPERTVLAPVDDTFEYTVMPGESIEDIARNFAVLVDDLLRYNDLVNTTDIRPGQRIKIPPMNY